MYGIHLEHNECPTRSFFNLHYSNKYRDIATSSEGFCGVEPINAAWSNYTYSKHCVHLEITGSHHCVQKSPPTVRIPAQRDQLKSWVHASIGRRNGEQWGYSWRELEWCWLLKVDAGGVDADHGWAETPSEWLSLISDKLAPLQKCYKQGVGEDDWCKHPA